MMTSNIFKELIHKFSLYYDYDKQESTVDQVVREEKWTDFLPSLVDFANCNVFKSFHLSLNME